MKKNLRAVSRQSKQDLHGVDVPDGDDVIDRAGRHDPSVVGDPHADEVGVARPPELDDVEAVAAVWNRRREEEKFVARHRQNFA